MGRKPKKRKNLPKGFGSVTMRNDTYRTNPALVRVSINGKQKAIAAAPTYQDGLVILSKYSTDPKKFLKNHLTFADVFNLMAPEEYKDIDELTVRNYMSVYKHLSRIYNKKFADITTADLQACIKDISKTAGQPTQKKARQIMHDCYKYVIKYNLFKVTDYSNYVDLDKYKPTYIKIPFNTRQLNRIKALIADNHPLARWAMAVLMMVYSGVRIGEFLRVKKADVKLGMRYFIVRKSKTPAGENRPIPINKKTLDYFKYWMSLPGQYLISRETDDRQVTYGVFRNRWDKVMKISNCKHTPHECRHTCATLFDDAGANDTAVKKILGHACEGVTKQVYTHKSLHQLKKAMDTI